MAIEDKTNSYQEFINKVTKIRNDRKKLYGDSWMESEDWELLAQIKNKVGRLQEFIINHKDEKIYESKIDTIVDLINYALFLGANLEETKK